MKTINTFWQILNEYKVEIPSIQRDYAQGRDDAKSKEIRTEFIKDLYKTLNTPLRQTHLDFIYGCVQNETLCLLDGQQRFTTLFLLHIYLAHKSGQLSEYKAALSKFVYKTRVSAEEFCQFLVTDNSLITTTIESEKISDHIKNQPRFYSVWLKDPTVKAMLNTLDTIHEEFSNKNSSEHLKKLTEGTPVTFDFLNMNNFQLRDELYVKMNARGIALTDWENFKAWLYEHIKNQKFTLNIELKKNEETEWKKWIDKEWTDYFWKKTEKQGNCTSQFDTYYLRFFKECGLLHHLEMKEKKDQSRCVGLISRLITSNEYITKDDYSEIFNTNTSIKWVIESINLLSEHEYEIKKELENVDVFERIKSESSFIDRFIISPSWKNRLLMYALLKHLHHHKGIGDNRDQFQRWMRVIRNLVENTPINSKNLINAIQSIDWMLSELKNCQKGEDILNLLASKTANDIKLSIASKTSDDIKSIFTKQFEEERLKARLALKDERKKWEGEIVSAENHSMFQGRISFLLFGSPSLEKFKRRFNSFEKLFLHHEIDDIFKFRATLALSDKIELHWQNRISFRSEDLKILLGYEQTSKSLGSIQKGLLKLIDFFIEKDFSKDALISICKTAQKDNNWMDDFIKYGDFFMKWDEPLDGENGDLWYNSKTKKIQNYYNQGIYVFHKNNAHDHDIMIGSAAHWRNSIIKKLIENKSNPNSEGDWKFEDKWRLDHQLEFPEHTFYKGHWFKIKHCEEEISLLFHGSEIRLHQTNGIENSKDIKIWKYDDSINPNETYEKILKHVRKNIKLV